METACVDFAQQLKARLLSRMGLSLTDDLQQSGQASLVIEKVDQSLAVLNLVPFLAEPKAPDAGQYFNQVSSVDELLAAYMTAKQSMVFETDCFETSCTVDDYAEHFVEQLFVNAKTFIDDQEAVVMAQWLRHLDVYVAVKATESLLNSQADLSVLKIAQQQNWQIHFDHLAIRCGSSRVQAAERVVDLLVQEHGYVAPQLSNERYYQFSDGWSAYPLYKILTNGQVLRLFIDQSDAGFPRQIIQHWNRVYGFTAHHLAMRATQLVNGRRESVSLANVMSTLKQHGVAILTPTGDYTQGLLEQVFTRPEKNLQVPSGIKDDLNRIDASLPTIIENGKLLELVSRTELPSEMVKAFFALYGIEWDSENALHSAPCFQYFLPAQAAHVIKTSMS